MDRLWSREEIIKMIDNYGVCKESIETLIDEKIKDISEKIELIWTNPDIYSECPKTQINLLDKAYKKLIIFYVDNIDSTSYKTKNYYLTNGDETIRQLTFQLNKNDDLNLNYYRNINYENNIINKTLIIDNCIKNDFKNTTSEIDNEYLIPAYICGVI